MARIEYMDECHVCGIIVGFDDENDPVIYWNGGFIEEEYTSKVKVIND